MGIPLILGIAGVGGLGIGIGHLLSKDSPKKDDFSDNLNDDEKEFADENYDLEDETSQNQTTINNSPNLPLPDAYAMAYANNILGVKNDNFFLNHNVNLQGNLKISKASVDRLTKGVNETSQANRLLDEYLLLSENNLGTTSALERATHDLTGGFIETSDGNGDFAKTGDAVVNIVSRNLMNGKGTLQERKIVRDNLMPRLKSDSDFLQAVLAYKRQMVDAQWQNLQRLQQGGLQPTDEQINDWYFNKQMVDFLENQKALLNDKKIKKIDYAQIRKFISNRRPYTTAAGKEMQNFQKQAQNNNNMRIFNRD